MDKQTTGKRLKNYKNNVWDNLRHGRTPRTPSDWETASLYHYYQADKAIFLMNIYNILEIDDREIAYTAEDIAYATSQFSDVAVIPIAVDLIGYDPDTFDQGLIQQIVIPPWQRAHQDEKLIEHLDKHTNLDKHFEAHQILDYVKRDTKIDFFSVSVPNNGAPQYDRRLTPDDTGGFVTKGFSEVIRWFGMKKLL